MQVAMLNVSYLSVEDISRELAYPLALVKRMGKHCAIGKTAS